MGSDKAGMFTSWPSSFRLNVLSNVSQKTVNVQKVREHNPAHIAFEALYSIYALVHEFLGPSACYIPTCSLKKQRIIMGHMVGSVMMGSVMMGSVMMGSLNCTQQGPIGSDKPPHFFLLEV